MSKSNSLGSSPIGYSSSGNEQYNFIPDLGVSAVESKKEDYSEQSNSLKQEGKKVTISNLRKLFSLDFPQFTDHKKVEKKIVSYNLEKGLIKSLKRVADEHNIYYSTFVSDAIHYWLKEHDYQK